MRMVFQSQDFGISAQEINYSQFTICRRYYLVSFSVLGATKGHSIFAHLVAASTNRLKKDNSLPIV
jgi:hypothetical protein